MPKKLKTKKVAKKIGPLKQSKPVGKVTHFYNKISVAIVKFNKPIKVGTVLKFRGKTTDFEQKIDSMQYDHKAIDVAPKNKQIGIKTKKRVREDDKVYLD